MECWLLEVVWVDVGWSAATTTTTGISTAVDATSY